MRPSALNNVHLCWTKAHDMVHACLCEVTMNLNLINERIREKGLKKGWVAEQIGVHPCTLRRFLKGETEIGLDSLAKLLKIINLKFESLTQKAS